MARFVEDSMSLCEIENGVRARWGGAVYLGCEMNNV